MFSGGTAGGQWILTYLKDTNIPFLNILTCFLLVSCLLSVTDINIYDGIRVVNSRERVECATKISIKWEP